MIYSWDPNTELSKAFETLTTLVIDGLRFGHFDLSVRVEMETGDRRRLTLSAGKSYRFSIPKEELKP
jgi:hypothetical protein